MAVLPAVALGLTGFGTAISVASAVQQGRAAAGAANVNAQMAQRQAQLQQREAQTRALLSEREATIADQDAAASITEAKYAESAQRQQGERFKAGQRAAVAGAGLEATGSPLLVMQDTASQLELDALQIRRAGEQQSADFQEEARMKRYGAKLLREQGQSALEMGDFQRQVGRYQGRVAGQAAQIGVIRSLLGGGAAMAGQFIRGGYLG
jgi:hypothetical protein